jgi:glycine/D-amino acid oxidase-like deaminating enzyme
VTIHEDTPVTTVGAHVVETTRGRIRAAHIVVATEGFLARMPGQRRRTLPMNSSMIVTERLSDRLWDRIGWDGAELLGDSAHVYFYAQRTPDGRIAFGGRGNPYRFGSGIDTDGGTPRSTVESLRAGLVDCFPDLDTVGIADAWSGVLGVPRDWCSSVVRDESTGVITVGGYVGHGVSTTNLAGRTVRDLILGADTDLVRLPWVEHRVRSWEPEPLRWLGVHGMYAAYRTADSWERRTGRGTSLLATVANRVSGR